MKKIFLLMVLQVTVFAAFPQKHDSNNLQRPDPVNPKDKQEYQGYTIRLIPALPAPRGMSGYGLIF